MKIKKVLEQAHYFKRSRILKISIFKLYSLILKKNIIGPSWSFIINFIYWCFHIFQLKKTIIKKQSLLFKVKKISDIQNIMKDFKWRKDNITDWTPWVLTIINNNLKDDCNGAATLGKFLLKFINIKSKIYYKI